MRRTRRLIKAGRRISVLSLVVCTSIAYGQTHSPDFVHSEHGTLVVLARRDERLAVASDSRMISVSGLPSEGCKLRLPTSTTLLAITGRATITVGYPNVERWNGLNLANEIFSAGGVESEKSIQQNEDLWLKSLQSVIRDYGVVPTPKDNEKIYVSLNIFTFISGKVRIFRVGLDAANGTFSPFETEVPAPPKGQTLTVQFGKTSMFDEATLGVRMSQSEQDRYKFLMYDERPKAASVKELNDLTLSFEKLGSDIDGRTATANKPAEIAGPFSSATFDASQRRWVTYPAEPCLKFLEHAPVKKPTGRLAHPPL
jgi:hypothetical protein